MNYCQNWRPDSRQLYFLCLFTVGPIPLSYDAGGVVVYLIVQRHLKVANPYVSAAARLEATVRAAQEALRFQVAD